LDSYTLISQRELNQLHSYRQKFWLGWGVSVLAAMLTFFCYIKWQASEATANDVRYFLSELKRTQNEQKQLTETLSRSLETQKVSVEAIKAVGDYLSDKDNIVDKNRGMVKK
jgi:hypothetical protein